ncbi:hypothetical protein GWK47_027853 [Chionoecetes opilio]|uniref:Uncharacterized protein n=1 Tax=Chionoecetes opilio TaxID=41210 RepID=A0A8J8WC05_CHIOP|nr:hypothetical protein GWK47_027853 [Chionoecetes opilio]
MASKIRRFFGQELRWWSTGMASSLMDLTTKKTCGRLPIIISGIGGPPTARRRQVGSGTGESNGGSGGLGPGDMGSRGSGSRDVLRHHGIQHPGPRNGACVLIEQNGERPAAFRLSSPYFLELVVHAGSSVFGCSSSGTPASALQTLPNLMGEQIREDFGRESWGRKWRLF